MPIQNRNGKIIINTYFSPCNKNVKFVYSIPDINISYALAYILNSRKNIYLRKRPRRKYIVLCKQQKTIHKAFGVEEPA